MNSGLLAKLLLNLAIGLVLLSGCVKSPELQIMCHRAPASPIGEHFSLLSWNLYKSNLSAHWQQEFSQIEAEYQPDFLLFQEVKLTHNQPFLSNYSWEMLANLLYPDQSYAGVLTASKTDSYQALGLLSHNKEPILDTAKPLLLSYYPLQQAKPLLIINIHGLNFVSIDSFKGQINQALEYIDSHNGPTLFAGDFNTWSSERQRWLNQQLGMLNLTKVSLQNPNSVTAFMGHPLDHIYASPHLRMIEAKVVSQSVQSDHNPLWAKFAVISNGQAKQPNRINSCKQGVLR